MKTTPTSRRRYLLCRAAVLSGVLVIAFGLMANATAATVFSAALDGPSEDPPVPTSGFGTAIVTHDPVAHTLKLEITFSDLVGPTTVAHIHAPTALPLSGNVGVAVTPGTLPGFPVGVTSGSYSHTLDLTLTGTYTAGFLSLGGGTVGGAEALLIEAFNTDRAYVNIHTTFRPGGEIRGFLAPVPEGGLPWAACVGAWAVLVLIRRRVGRP